MSSPTAVTSRSGTQLSAGPAAWIKDRLVTERGSSGT
jgi:hypothetical protein